MRMNSEAIHSVELWSAFIVDLSTHAKERSAHENAIEESSLAERMIVRECEVVDLDTDLCWKSLE